MKAARALLLAAAAAAPLDLARAQGPDAVRGALLYENHCVACHDSRAHVRHNRKARTRGEVRAWVRLWQSTQGLGWGPGDVRDVTEWLYLRFYDPARPSPAPAADNARS